VYPGSNLPTYAFDPDDDDQSKSFVRFFNEDSITEGEPVASAHFPGKIKRDTPPLKVPSRGDGGEGRGG